jgi:hypothetical protein
MNSPMFKEGITKANDQKTEQDKLKQGNLALGIGIITLNEESYGKDKFIHIYNQDGSLWYQFTFYYNDSGRKFEYANENFKPFAFHLDYFVLALRCLDEDGNHYEVIVDEETGLKKFVRKDDETLKFETWEQHILKTFAVDFDREKNPLRETPGGKIKKVDLPKEVTFHPVEISGEWLKVRWDISKKKKNNTEFGWIKWKENNNLLVELFYFS